MDSIITSSNKEIIQLKYTIGIQNKMIDELSSEITEMKVNFKVEKIMMERKIDVLRRQNEAMECKLKDIEADSSDYNSQIQQFKVLQNKVDRLAEKDSYIQLKKDMTDLMKDLKSAKEQNDLSSIKSLAFISENNQISANENLEEDVKQISADVPISNVDNDLEIFDVVPLQDIIGSVSEEKELTESTNHHRPTVLVIEEHSVSEDVTRSTTPVTVEEQTSSISTIDEDLCPVTVLSEMSSVISSKTTTAAGVDVKEKDWFNMVDEMSKEWPNNGLKKLCEGLGDEMPIHSYTKLDEIEECLVDCHLMGRTVGAKGPTETVAKHRATTLMSYEAEHSLVGEQAENPGKDWINASDDASLLLADEPTGEDAIPADNALRQLLSSTNPSMRKLKELDAVKNPTTELYIDFLDQIAIEEQLILSYDIIEPKTGDDCCVRLKVSSIEWTTEGSAKSAQEAQILTAYNFLMFIKNYKM